MSDGGSISSESVVGASLSAPRAEAVSADGVSGPVDETVRSVGEGSGADHSRGSSILGPLIQQVDLPSGATARLLAFVLAFGCVSVLALAVYLEPDSRGFGTHRQLGFGPCGMRLMSGLPCPTCGMTTAYAYTVRGRLWAGFKAQPMGVVLCMMTLLTAIISIRALLVGRIPTINWYRVSPSHLAVGFVGLLIAAWAYKIVITLLDGPA